MASAVGAAIAKVSGAVDTVVIPGDNTIQEHVKEAERLAIKRCVAAGGDRATAEVMEIDSVPIPYVTNGATRITVRVVADPDQSFIGDVPTILDRLTEEADGDDELDTNDNVSPSFHGASLKSSSHDDYVEVDLESYRPDLRDDLWSLSKTDLDLFLDGTGVLGVGSCGESYPSYIACLEQLSAGRPVTIRRQATISDSSVIVDVGFKGSPTVYLERIPRLHAYVPLTCSIAVLGFTNLCSTIGIPMRSMLFQMPLILLISITSSPMKSVASTPSNRYSPHPGSARPLSTPTPCLARSPFSGRQCAA